MFALLMCALHTPSNVLLVLRTPANVTLKSLVCVVMEI